MASNPSEVDDLALVSAAREGDDSAVAELWMRHYPPTLTLARRLSRQERDAEEIASDAFSAMLQALHGGAGPTQSVRAYLATSVRNLVVSRARHTSSRDVMTDDIAAFDASTTTGADPVSKHAELGLMREAFASLPRRWQIVLWRTAVDQDTNIEVARELDMTPNGVAALARRARVGLRKAYLAVHVTRNGVDPDCEPFVDRLVELVAPGVRPGPDDVRAHVAGCEKCQQRLEELRSVDRRMPALLLPMVLGVATPGALFSTGHAAVGPAAGATHPTVHAGSPSAHLAAASSKGSSWVAIGAGATGVAAAVLVVGHLLGQTGPKPATDLRVTTAASGPQTALNIQFRTGEPVHDVVLTLEAPGRLVLGGSDGDWPRCAQAIDAITCTAARIATGTPRAADAEQLTGTVRLETASLPATGATISVAFTGSDGQRVTSSVGVPPALGKE